jgi:hypothetical protein
MAGGNHRGTGDDELPPPLAGTIRPWDRETAYHSFLGTFEQLVG